MFSIIIVIGTRPEAIKLAPIIREAKKKKELKAYVCSSSQHEELLQTHLSELEINVDYAIVPNREKLTIGRQVSKMLFEFDQLFETCRPDLVVTQGDTSTAFAASMAAFYSLIPVAHIESGLRTKQKQSPWPEETHRVMIDEVSDLFFAPTEKAKLNLLKEGKAPERVWVTGNTSIDNLRYYSSRFECSSEKRRPYVLVTIHRRENHGEPLKNISLALIKLSELYPEIDFIFFLHPNPHVCGPAKEILKGKDNIKLIHPLDYISFIKQLKDSLFVITDSGGLQEEAPYFGKPVVIVRETTERVEGLDAKTAILSGTEQASIIKIVSQLLSDKALFNSMSRVHLSYGDGFAGEKIVNVIVDELTHKRSELIGRIH